jgi:DNA-binding CsgD family transcriptional regulator
MRKMENVAADISQYRSLLIKRVKDAFLHKEPLSAVDRADQVEKYKLLLDNLNGFIVICNYTTGLYEYVSDGIRAHLGYDVKDYSNEELTNFVFSVIHEKHRGFLLNSFLPLVFQYFKEYASHINATDYRYTCGIKVKNVYGSYLWYLIDTVIIEVDENGSPLRTLITCTNINPFKKDDVVYYNLLKKNHDGIYEVMVEGVEDNKKDEYQLTNREVEVINLISQGLTNKEIADKLFISLNTIKTHRKSIMKKTKCKGTAELTNFAFSRGLL